MERITRPRFLHFDFWLLGATLLLVLIGILMIYSATECITNEPLDWQSTSVRQLIYAAVGISGMLVLTIIDYRLYRSLHWIILAFTVVILAIVFAIGQITHGAQRWIDLRVFLFQPSELSKLLLVLVMARYMSNHQEEMMQLRHLFISFLIIALPISLIYFQPDLGTTIVIIAAWGIMALASGIKVQYILIILAIAVIAAPLIWTGLLPYQQERILTFLDPTRDPLGAGYNVTQARIAIGAGGLWGLGFCSGTQSQLRFLRIRQTDFIFSVIGEELGFIGATIVIVLFVFIILRLIRAAMLARDAYGKLLIVGITGIVIIQSYINLGMNVGLLPVTGIPLPFVSAGGSSLITLLIAQGIVQSVLLRHRGLRLEGAGRNYA